MKKAIHFALSYLFSLAMVAGIWVVAYMAPTLRRDVFREFIGDKVVRINVASKFGQWRGTGFHIEAPSGKVYILTNRHVCDGANNGVVTIQDHGISIVRKVVEMSRKSDLCLVEPTQKSGLSLAGHASPGSIIATLGHPSGYPLTMTEGEIVGPEQVHFVQLYRGPGTCNWDNQVIIEMNVPKADVPQGLGGFFTFSAARRPSPKETTKVTVCVTAETSVVTTSQIKPGSSGSPVLDIFGHVVGIQHASSEDDYWGRMVSLKNIKEFISRR